MEFLTATGKQLAYHRSDRKSQIIVLFNLKTTPQAFKLPRNGKWTALLGDGKLMANKAALLAISSLILQQKEVHTK